MLYILLIIIAGFLYLIYKGQNTKPASKEAIMQNAEAEIARAEARLLDLIETNHLKDYMDTEKALFDCGRLNFIRLNERFKHEELKREQAIKDWLDYMQALNDAVYASLQLDVCTSEESDTYYKERSDLFIKISEIDKRFKELLGNEYADPEKLITPPEEKMKQFMEKNINKEK